MKTRAISFLYESAIKPVLFKFPADNVHNHFLRVGKLLGKNEVAKKAIGRIFKYENSTLHQSVCGIDFSNPIGLAAGFDYNADLVNILPSIGFGFHSVGTLTNEAYEGNKPPMLGRLPKSKSLLVNKGFKNDGLDSVLDRLPQPNPKVPYGVSIGSTNKKYNSFDEIVADIESGFRKADSNKCFSYFELNISCPNLTNIGEFPERVDTVNGLKEVLDRLEGLNLNRPVFIKMPLEKEIHKIDELIVVARDYDFIKGLIFANLAKDRNNPFLNKEEVGLAGAGNFSGKPTFERSNELISHSFKLYGDRFVIIGCGGVFNAEDAYKKIRLGASLVQLVTGMVYRGPSVIGEINQGLVELIKKDGFKSVGEAVGIDSL